MICTLALALQTVNAALLLLALLLGYRAYKELRSEGVGPGEAWRTMLDVANTFQHTVQAHEQRIRDLEDRLAS